MKIKTILAILCFFLLIGCLNREIFLSDYRVFNIEYSSSEKVLFGNYSIMLPKKLDDYGILSMTREKPHKKKFKHHSFQTVFGSFPLFL